MGEHPASRATNDDRYRSLFDEHPHAVFALDLTGRFTDVNHAASLISGHSPDQLLGMVFGVLVTPDDRDRAAAAFAGALAREPQRLELQITRADATTADLAVTAIPLVVDDEVVGAYGVAEDVTAAKTAARELETTRRLAAESARAKSDFIARMSHEIRTPLTSILASAELLGSTASGEQQPLVATLSRSTSRLLHLVDSVLDFDRTSAASVEDTEEFDLREVIAAAVAQVEPQARARGIDVEVDVDRQVPRRARDHPEWTTEILVNLLRNAVTFTPAGRVTLRVGLLPPSSTPVRGRKHAVLYRVSDTGVGIPADELEAVFEPFHRSAANPPGVPGAGLGLSVVRQLTTISGGQVAVSSTLGVGSTFTVTLPVLPVS